MASKYPVTTTSTLKSGEMECFDVNNQRVIVARVEDEFFAFEELCSHEDFPLWYGALKKGYRVECSLHGAQFDIRDGQPVFEPATKPIRTFPISIDNDTILVELPD